MKHTVVVGIALAGVMVLGAHQAVAQDKRADLGCKLSFFRSMAGPLCTRTPMARVW